MYSRRRAGSRRDELGAGLGVWLELGWLGLAWLSGLAGWLWLALAGWLAWHLEGPGCKKWCHSQPKSTFHVKSIKKASVFEGDIDFDRFPRIT